MSQRCDSDAPAEIARQLAPSPALERVLAADGGGAQSAIGACYAGRSVFITGATGFIGKVNSRDATMMIGTCDTTGH